MTESLEDIFCKHMPHVDASMATTFAANMQAYYEQFKVFRNESINYEALPDYQNTQQHILHAPKDSFWLYSPHFKKTMALAIGGLFGTTITKIGFGVWCQCIIFIDEHSNRWIVVIDEPPACGEGFRKISMFFPRGKTQLCNCMTTSAAPLKTLIDSALCPPLVAWNFDSSEFCSD